MSNNDHTSLAVRWPLWMFLCGVAWGYLLAAMSTSQGARVAVGIGYVVLCAAWWPLDFSYHRGRRAAASGETT